jgi:hypothetical protein
MGSFFRVARQRAERRVASFGNGWMMLAAGCEFSRSVRLASGCSDHLAGGALVFWQRSRDATGQIGLFRKYSDGGKRRFSFVWAGLHNRFVFSSGQAARAARCVFLLGAPSRREAALMQVLFCRIQLCPLGSFGPICSGHSGPAARESPYQT